MAAFHGDDNMMAIVKQVVGQTKSRHAIECGTYEGDSARAFAKLVENVDTIEIRDDFFKKAKQDGVGIDNIVYWLGSSATTLPLVMVYTHDRDIFFLDAHWQDEWPLQKELQIINQHRIGGRNFTVIIDDFQHPFRKDFYGSNGGGGTVGDERYGPRIKVDDTPCNMDTFGDYLKGFKEIWLPCYAGGGPGFVIASDYELNLSPLAERYNF